MHAVTIEDGALAWRPHPDPTPGTGELLVAVRAAGLNGADMLQRRGRYAAPPGAPPDVPGLELAGEVVGVGPAVRGFGIGDRVMAVVAGGGQAELAVVHERCAIPVPDGMGWPAAGGFPEVFTTAHDALFTQCGLQPGERCCIHGAAGGVGIAAVQLAAWAGAEVVATVRSPELRGDVARIGQRCGKVTVVAPETFADTGPYDIVVELVGAPNMAADLEALAPGGRIAVIGVGAGATAELDLLTLMAKRARIHGSVLRPRPLEQKAEAAQRVIHHVLPGLRDGALTVPIAATYAMPDAEAAYARFLAGAKLGKIVLTVP